MRAILQAARLLAALFLLWLPLAAAAQTMPPAPLTQEQREAGMRAAWMAVSKNAQPGPATIGLLDQALLALPKGMVFVPKAEALDLLRAYGNRPSVDTTVGLVISETADWWVVVRFIKEGFVRDDDARDWNADELLTGLRAGTEETNKERAQRGFPELEIIGWLDKPAYDADTHRLVWALASRIKGEPDGPGGSVNYNTYQLGRDGYFSLNLLTSTTNLPADKPVATTLLANLSYVDGKRYSDFNAGTDRVAEYGLAALVGVVAAKKLGLLALVAAFLAKFGAVAVAFAVKSAKLLVLAVVALGAGVARLFRRGGKTPPPAPTV